VNIRRIRKIPGTFRLCMPLRRWKNGVVLDSSIRAVTQDDIRMNIHKAAGKSVETRIVSEANRMNGSARTYRLAVCRAGTAEMAVIRSMKARANTRGRGSLRIATNTTKKMTATIFALGSIVYILDFLAY
jgi:hypothetical protein